ncbi:MAG: hypothetical protein AAB533_01710 [Patescibacteria group bacterium]
MYEAKTGEWSTRLVVITAALYRVTGLLPAGEPLRSALREHANAVLAGCVGEARGATRDGARLESKMEALLGFLAVAALLPEMKEENFLVLEREYQACFAAREYHLQTRAGQKQSREDEGVEYRVPAAPTAPGRKKERRPAAIRPDAKDPGLNVRQRTILARLQNGEKMKASDFSDVLRGVSPKTIQRDLHDLVSQNAIKKEGERRWTIYRSSDQNVR